MALKDFAERVQEGDAHLSNRRHRPRPLRIVIGSIRRLAHDRVPLHLAVRSGAAGLRDLCPADGFPVQVVGGMEYPCIGFEDLRYLERDRSELTAEPWLNPRAGRGPVRDFEVLGLHALTVAERQQFERHRRPSAAPGRQSRALRARPPDELADDFDFWMPWNCGRKTDSTAAQLRRLARHSPEDAEALHRRRSPQSGRADRPHPQHMKSVSHPIAQGRAT